ncbi:ATPase P [candidate division KSB1 bacterium]|nr:ATPase P [candidate division KSB1 bacterium]
MIELSIPGFRTLRLENLVLDFNGTIACDGRLLDGISERVEKLSSLLKIFILTANTYSSVKQAASGMPCEIVVLSDPDEARAKAEFVKTLGEDKTAAIGNGRNDRLMLKEAALGIAVIQTEGAATENVLAADIVCTHIHAALDLLLNPMRLKATLRS